MKKTSKGMEQRTGGRSIKCGGLVATVLCSCLMMVLSAQAASFDCAKASTKVEHMICDNPEISKLDEELNAIYRIMLQEEKQTSSIKQAQKQWMKERSACHEAGCVKTTYLARIRELSAAFTRARVNPQTATGLPAYTGHYVMVKGKGVEVCEAYKKNFESFDNLIPMACERKYNPAIKGFSSPKWEKLDIKKYFDLYKKAEIYLQEGWHGANREDILDGIEGRAEHQKIELNLARLDLNDDGKLAYVLAVRDFGCGPTPSLTEEFRKTRIYILNDALTDIDYQRQDAWFNSYNNATIGLFNGSTYIEHYEPDDNWGHLLTGSGRLYISKEESMEQITKESPGDEVAGRLKRICEFHYLPPSEKN